MTGMAFDTEIGVTRPAIKSLLHRDFLPSEVSATKPVRRVGSIDAYRGLVMLLMMAEVLNVRHMADMLPDSGFWSFLAYHQSHVEWIGCSLHDLIQPSFSFLVGVALPFSLVRRASEGQSALRRTLHAFWRALVLVLLGVFLRSIHHPQTYWTFEDTLSQIGLGYGFLYILANRPTIVQWSALAVILIGYWAAFGLYPAPGNDFDWKSAGVDKNDAQTHLSGFAEHWSKNTNAAWAFDTWLLNKFPREAKPAKGSTAKPPDPADAEFRNNSGGYSTLSFIPTLGTMILGLLAGGVLVGARSPPAKIRWLLATGVVCLAAGWLLGALGICPVVKRIWTPSWVLFSGGWCFLILAGFYAVMDAWGRRRWAFVLVVIGMNSIAAYLIAHLFPDFIRAALPRHVGPEAFRYFGSAYEQLLLGLGVLVVEWLILFWMYRRKIFLRI
jgi:heparan-alpha-glucosaminide N-acetyltransferase